MGKFDIYKHTVRLDTTAGKDVEYVLLPVGGDKIDKLLSVAMKGNTEDMSESDLKAMRELVEETLIKSYPNENAESMRLFAQQNLTVFMQPVLSVNMGKNIEVESQS